MFYLLTTLTLHRPVQTHITDFFYAFILNNTLQLLVYTKTPPYVLLGGSDLQDDTNVDR